MGTPANQKRVAVACTLPPDLAARLNSEANARMLHTSLLIEKAVAAFLPTLPPLDAVVVGS